MTVSSQVGTAVGDTIISVSPTKAASHIYKYKIADVEQLVHLNDDVSSWNDWDGNDEITAASGLVITVVVADSTYHAKKIGAVVITANEEE